MLNAIGKKSMERFFSGSVHPCVLKLKSLLKFVYNGQGGLFSGWVCFAGMERTMVFVETKRQADFIAAHLCQENVPTTSIHG